MDLAVLHTSPKLAFSAVLSWANRLELLLYGSDALLRILDVVVLHAEPEGPRWLRRKFLVCSLYECLNSLGRELVVAEMYFLNTLAMLEEFGQLGGTFIIDCITEELQDPKICALLAEANKIYNAGSGDTVAREVDLSIGI